MGSKDQSKSGKPYGSSKDGNKKGPGRSTRPGKHKGLKAGTFAQMREGQDLIAFGTPGANAVRLFVEGLEKFQNQNRQPRHLVLILAKGLETDFQAYQVDFKEVAPLIPRAKLVDAERPYYLFAFKRRWLSILDGTQVTMEKIEKRA